MTPKIKIALGLRFGGKDPATGLPRFIPPEWSIMLRCLRMPPAANQSMHIAKGMKVEDASEHLAESAIKVDAEYLLQLDDDTVSPVEAPSELIRVLDNAPEDVAAIGGIYVTRTVPEHPTVFMSPGSGPFWRWKRGDIFPCWAIGGGCFMVRLSVLRSIPKPWFRFIRSIEEAKQYPDVWDQLEAFGKNLASFDMGEDIFFCSKLAAYGYKVLAHGGILPTHYDQIGSPHVLPADSYPMTGGNGTGLMPTTWREEALRQQP